MLAVILRREAGFTLEESGQLLRAFEAHLAGDLTDFGATGRDRGRFEVCKAHGRAHGTTRW